MGGAHLAGLVQLPVVDVDGDDLRGSGEAGADDGRVADAAAADDGDGVAAADVSGVDRGADAGHHAAAEEARDLGGDGRVDLGALTGGDEGLLGEGADAEGRGELRAVEQGHPLLRVVGGEAVPGAAAQAGAAGAADGAPVEDHEVAGGDVGDALADGLDDSRGLVAEQEGELVVDRALLVVEIGVTDAAGLDLHDRLAGAGVGDHDGLHAYRFVPARGDDPLDVLRHRELPFLRPDLVRLLRTTIS